MKEKVDSLNKKFICELSSKIEDNEKIIEDLYNEVGSLEKFKQLHLCNYCTKEFAVCESEVILGHGLGNDNIVECDIFEEKVYG